MNQDEPSEDPTARSRATTARLLPAGAVLAGALLSLFGWSWDIQWHNDVGPDTFFTLPHLFLYTGSALCGLTALAVVLRTTAAQRSGRPVDAGAGGGSVRVFGGAFLAPVAYLVTGSAAAVFLLYGLWDQWWHGLYGFDAQLNSPPHVGLLLGNLTTILGATMIFAAARNERWGRIGVVASLGMMVAFIPVPSDAFQQLGGVIDWITVCVAGLTTLLLTMAVALFQRPGAALLVAAAVAAVQGVLWLFTPWATQTYADSVGLPMRDFVAPVPVMPSWIPVTVVVAALILEAARALGRARSWSARVVTPLWGAAASAALAVLIPLQQVLFNSIPLPGLTATVLYLTPVALVAAGVGALGGTAGWRLGLMLRMLDRHTAPTAGTGTDVPGTHTDVQGATA